MAGLQRCPAIPSRQRVVVTVSDVAGHSSDEVCDLSSISVTNLRVLPPRGQAALRAVLAAALDQGGDRVHCNEFAYLVTAYLDGALPAETERRFVEHLAECDGCDRYLEQIRATMDNPGHLPEQHLAPEARDRLLAAFRNWPAGQ